jgi:PKD repeat protein
MRKLALLFGVLAACLSLPSFAGDREYLIAVERRMPEDLSVLLKADVPVVLETSGTLFAEAGEEAIAWLGANGYATHLLDSAPEAWTYLQVGTRPDSDPAALHRAGVVLYAEENWILLRLWPGLTAEALAGQPFFVAPVAHRPLAPPRPAPAGRDMNAPLLAADPLIQRMVNRVVHQNITSTWQAVVPPNPPGTGTRYTTTAGCGDEAAWAFSFFQGLGYDTSYQNYKSGYAPNVVATLPGLLHPENVYILVGHLDDMPSSGYAPGADDNASGSVVVLEAARVMNCDVFDATLKFILVTGEETGLEGSDAYAEAAQTAGENILGVVNMDMPGWAGDGSPSPENLDLNYNAASQPLGQLFAQAASTYGTGLSVDAFLCPSLTASDHYSFWQRGYPAVCGITDNEGYCSHGGHYPYYHTSNDTIANCGDPGFFYSVVRASVAAMGELGQPFKVSFGAPAYACAAAAEVVLGDRDLNTDPGAVETITASVSSTRETVAETVLLTEDGPDSPVFRGSIALATSPPAHGDGALSVNEGDTLTAAYVDALDCGGASGTSFTGTALVDCTAPTISGVAAGSLTESTAVITWTTDEASTSRVEYGPAAPPALTEEDASLVTAHSVTLTGLSPCTTYRFSVSSADAAGNESQDDHGGLYHTFKTTGRAYAFGPETAEGTTTLVPGGQWHVSTCRAFSGTHAWKCGTASCSGTYANSQDAYLTSPAVDLGAPGHGYRLRFREWYETESGYDYCHVQVSTNGGSTWTTVRSGASGSSGGWVLRDLDLSSYSGSAFKVRFWFHTDSNTVDEGWYLDDVEVSRSEACAPDPLTCTAVGSPLDGDAPLTVSFTGQALGGTPPYAFTWVFGDGTPNGSGASVNHTYNAAGTFTARLQAADSGVPAQTATSDFVTVVSRAPLAASASASPQRGLAPLAVQYSASASGGTPPYAYGWTFGDGAAGSGASPSHTYAAPGVYTARVTVTDSKVPPRTAQGPDLAVTVRQVLSASSQAYPNHGEPPLEVAFSGSAAGGVPPYAYAWTFGDGGTSSGASPLHTYAGPGSYEVHLTVTDADSPAQTAEAGVLSVLVTSVLSASASALPSAGHAPLGVTFTGEASGGLPPLAYTWSFGDGSPAVEGLSVSHTYEQAGTYSASLTVTDSSEPPLAVAAVPLTITVHPALTGAAAVLPASGVAPLDVALSATGDGGLPPYSFTWDPGDGTGPLAGASLSHVFAQPGTYTVRCTVRDAADPQGTFAAPDLTVTVYAPLTVSTLTSPAAGVAPFETILSASVSGGLPPYGYAWSFGDGATGTGSPVSHTFTSPGVYDAAVTVTDGSGQTVQAHASVTAAAPLALSVQASPERGNAPLTVTLTALPSGGLAPFSTAWTFSDGGAASGNPVAHTFVSPGAYTAQAAVTDALGQTAAASAPVTAVDPPVLSGAVKKAGPFRIKVRGANFHPGAQVLVNGTPVPETRRRSDTELVARGGAALKALLPKGQAVALFVLNPDDGGTSAPLPFTR